MQKVFCPYCGHQAQYVNTEVIYGRSYGMAYLCRKCDAYVGVHKGTDKPKGTLANAELRIWRKCTHAAFDPLWMNGIFRHRRNAAYAWLAEQMQIPIEMAHIGLFDVDQCKAALAVIAKYKKSKHEKGVDTNGKRPKGVQRIAGTV